MVEKDYRLVLIGNTQVGLIGLKEIFEELKSQKDKPEYGEEAPLFIKESLKPQLDHATQDH